jgi:hypothetical protein
MNHTRGELYTCCNEQALLACPMTISRRNLQAIRAIEKSGKGTKQCSFQMDHISEGYLILKLANLKTTQRYLHQDKRVAFFITVLEKQISQNCSQWREQENKP